MDLRDLRVEDLTIRLLDVERSDAIEAGDNLKLRIAETRRLRIERVRDNDSFSVTFEGTVKGIALGPVGAERDLSPSLLEFLYTQRFLAPFWAVVASLWGLLMGARKWLRGAAP